jgi:Flagellar filament outer layer protein Flaa
MKTRILVLLLLCLLNVKTLFSLEAVLLDFNNLDNTSLNFSGVIEGKGYPEELLKEMVVSLEPTRWIIRVNNSSWLNDARDKTYLFPLKSSQNYPNQTVLGIRIYFPERHASSYATLVPPFEIPSYYDDPKNPTGKGDMFLNKGIVRNVGVLRKLSVLALGNNFRYSIYVKIKDHRGEIRDLFIGYLDYTGWKVKSWLNPHLEEDLKSRDVKKKYSPLYPDEYPYVKLLGFRIQRTDPEVTGNFVTMIKEVTLEYDEAIIPTGKTEDKQEEIFGIYKEELMNRAKLEMRNVDRRIFMEWEERQKQHKDDSTLPRVDQQKVNNAAAATNNQTPQQTPQPQKTN